MKTISILIIVLVGACLDADAEMRTWTFKDGRTIEAEIAEGIRGITSVKLQTTDGRKIEVPLDQLSQEDLEYIELSHPPKLDIDILKSFRQTLYSGKLSKWAADVRPPEIHASFGIRVKQLSTENYDYPLTAEVFAIGRQIYADRYILLHRESWTFRLTKENKRRFEAESKQRVILRDFILRDWYNQGGYARRGEKFHGYIIIVTDERGEIIAHEESSNWLYNNLDNLKKLSSGNYMDQTCARRYPIRPESIHLLSF